jgi:DNA-binding NarL/FixJ family response regulator
VVSRARFGQEPVKRDRFGEPRLAVSVRTAAARRAVSALLQDEFRLAARSSTPDALIKRCADRHPDVAVIELELNAQTAIRTLRRVHEALPNTRIVFIAHATRERDARRILQAGVDGVVLQSDVEHTLGPTLRAVLAGQLALPREHRHHVEKRPLSFREQQVLGVVISGATNRQTADELFLTESTVKGHLASAFAKLGVRSRAEAAAVLLDPDAEAVHRLPPSVWPRGWSGAFQAQLGGSRPRTGPPAGRSAPESAGGKPRRGLVSGSH